MNTTRILMLSIVLLVGCAAQAVSSESELDEMLAGKADFWGNGPGARLMPDHAFETTNIDAAALTKFLTETRSSWGGASFLATYEIDGTPFPERLRAVAAEHEVNPLLLLAVMQAQTSLVSQTFVPADNVLASAMRCRCDSSISNRECRYSADDVASLDGQLHCAANKLRGAFDVAGDLEATAAGYEIDVIHSSTGTSPNNRATAAIYSYMDDGELFFLVWNQFVRHYFAQIDGDPMDWLRLPYAEGFIGGACRGDDDCLFEGGRCMRGLNGKRACTMACNENGLCPDRTGEGYPVTLCVAGETSGFAPGGGFCVPRCQGSDDVCRDGFFCQGNVSRYGSSTYRRDACVAPDTHTPGEPVDTGDGDREPDPEVSASIDDAKWSIRITHVTGSEFSSWTSGSDNERWDGGLANYAPDLDVQVWIGRTPECTLEDSQSINSSQTSCARFDNTGVVQADTFDVTMDRMLFSEHAGRTPVDTDYLINGIHFQIRDSDWDGYYLMSECHYGIDRSVLEHLDDLRPGGLTVDCGSGFDDTGARVDHQVTFEIVRADVDDGSDG